MHHIKCFIDSVWKYYCLTWGFILSFILLIGYCCIDGFYQSAITHTLMLSPYIFIKRICFVFIEGLLLSPFYLWLKKRKLTVLVYSIIVLFFFVQRFLLLNFSRSISPDVLLMIAETNNDEACEFIAAFSGTSNSFRCYVECIIAIVVISLLELINTRFKTIHTSLSIKGIGILFSMIAVLIGTTYMKTWYQLMKTETTEELAGWEVKERVRYSDLFTKVLYSARGVMIAINEIRHATNVAENFSEDISFVASTDSLNIVFVIGESCIQKHLGIYGYPLNTTPNMQLEMDRGNLFAFDDVVSPYQSTSPTIKNLMSCNSISNSENWADYPFFPFVFNKAGYHVYFWDNQKQMDTHKGYTFALNSFLYNRTISSVYEQTNDSCYVYDGGLIDSFIDKYPNFKQSKYNLFMFHLIGQHMHYTNRYPHNKTYKYFNVDSIHGKYSWLTDEKKQYIADYDNATRYNDDVMSKLFDFFRSSTTIIVYLSDHGEEVYDYRDSYGRSFDKEHISKEVIDYQFRIPFIIWVSDSYKEIYPQKIDAFKNSLHKPFISDITYNMLFDIAEIDCSLYQESRDLISSKYKAGKRMLMGTINCDSIISKGK